MLDVIRRTYPRAHSTHDIVEAMFAVFDQEFGLAPAQIIHADSMCADDLNTIEYPPRALEMLGPFKLGGLNGFPFAGLTGMAAFAGHVPADGAVFVFHGPHIGVTKTGVVGEIMRPGQLHPLGLLLLASRTKFRCSHLVFMGGILINGDHDVGLFCEMRRIVHVEVESGKRRDLMPMLRL